jgi:ribosomal protein S18 acetylase RimI-like enzyme
VQAGGLVYRLARAGDAAAVAELHAESWRRHYRGAYSDAFLGGDVHGDRRRVWTARLAEPDPGRVTILAEDAGSRGLAGFVNVAFDEDPDWGALVDNLHVAGGRQRRGIGSRLLSLAAESVVGRAPAGGLYLWVLKQNFDARAFYEARGARLAGSAPVSAPGGVAGRLSGSPLKLRYAWPAPQVLLRPA